MEHFFDAIETEHLEIAAYTGLVEKARAMGLTGSSSRTSSRRRPCCSS